MIPNIGIWIAVGLFVLGAVCGSFACCQVWRLKFREYGEKLGSRSVCLECGKTLRWYELIPMVSWVIQRGKCRGCRAKIGWQEILCELLTGMMFVATWLFWPERFGGASESIWNYAGMAGFLVLLMGLLILFVYDLRWGKLPVGVLIFCVICAILEIVLVKSDGFLREFSWVSAVGGLVLLPALYFVLYKISNERWVGGGDWILALVCAIMLCDATLCLLCLLCANLLGCVVAIPLLLRGKGKNARLPMGPLLIVGFLVVFFCGDMIMGVLGL